MSCYSADGEITSICADFLVELREARQAQRRDTGEDKPFVLLFQCLMEASKSPEARIAGPRQPKNFPRISQESAFPCEVWQIEA
jgi:hypothetical protein